MINQLSNPFFLLYSAAFISNVLLLIVIFFQKKRVGTTMFWFSILITLSCFWAFAQVMLFITTGAQYMVWYALTELTVTVIMPFFLCFIIAFVGKEHLLARLPVALSLVIPDLVLLFLYWKTDWVTIHDFSKVIAVPWGYQLPRQPVPWDIVVNSIYCLTALIVLVWKFIVEKDSSRKRVVLLVTFAFSLPILGGILFQGLIPALTNTAEFPAASPLLLITCIIIGIVLLRYGKEAIGLIDVSYDVIHTIPNPLVILDSSNTIVIANTPFTSLLDLSQDLLVGKPLLSVAVGEDGRGHWQKEVFDVLAGGHDVEDIAISMKKADGASFPVRVHAVARRGSDGKIVSTVMLVTDISRVKEKEQELLHAMKSQQEQNVLLQDNKSAMLNLLEDARMLEEDLKRERDRANAIVSSMSEGLFVVDSKGQIVLVNPMAKKLLGLDSDKVIGRPLTDVVMMRKGKKDVPAADRPLHHVLATGVPVTYGLEDDYYLRSIDGQLIPISLSIAPLRRGDEIVGALETFHDTTRDKQVKETIEQTVEERTLQLKEEQARLTASINSLEMGFILTDIDGGIISKNPAASSLLNLPWGTKNFADMDEALKGSFSLVELHNKARNEHKPVDKRNVSYGGKFIDIFIAPIYIGGRDEDFIGSVLLIQDQTEAKVLERSRDEFFSIASHELRTPLTAIRGNTSLIQEHYSDKLDPELKEMIGDVHDSSIRLIDIVNDFLNMGRLEQQRFTFKNEPFKMEDLITSALKEYEVTGSRQQLGLEFVQPATPIHPAFADRERVRQVLVNLIGNSLKFTEKGGVKVFVREDSGMVEVSITDTGHGIPLQNQALLFHKFQQAGDSLFTRDTTKGTGLGLYISKLMIEAMGGKIWLVKSEEGVGSTFAFSLPLASTGAL